MKQTTDLQKAQIASVLKDTSIACLLTESAPGVLEVAGPLNIGDAAAVNGTMKACGFVGGGRRQFNNGEFCFARYTVPTDAWIMQHEQDEREYVIGLTGVAPEEL